MVQGDIFVGMETNHKVYNCLWGQLEVIHMVMIDICINWIYIFLRTICALLQIKSSTIFVALSMKHNILYEQIDKWRIVTNSISYNDSTVA